ncbi:hypothetical protein TNCV_2483891 [Trichonephila clavipes]|uniref:Uncharacterized protein n=1 Tax=Trichonephila clavipes TaxID=2585209 RepID=A0A8X6VZE1_TRICX|nr:hypothetical protein TNCV_2483891 [Trichonephila clavipes]
MAPLVSRRPGRVRTNRTREVEGDFCGLPVRRDERRVVDPPLVFIMGSRRREESHKEKRLGRWRTEIGVERKERP